MNLSTEEMLELSDAYISDAEDRMDKSEEEFSCLISQAFSSIGIGHALVAIGQELKRFNDATDLERPDEEINKKAPKIDEDLGW